MSVFWLVVYGVTSFAAGIAVGFMIGVRSAPFDVSERFVFKCPECKGTEYMAVSSPEIGVRVYCNTCWARTQVVDPA